MRGLVLLWVALAPQGPLAEPCPGAPSEAVAQLTAEKCEGCFELQDFVTEHKYVYVLFYRATGRLNVDVRSKFLKTAQEWRWSRVHFGQIDTDRDKPMVEKWMEPHMTPTNILFRDGQGVEVDPKDFEVLKNKYDAGPQGQRWWLTKYLGDDKEGSNLHYAIPVDGSKSLKRSLRRGNRTMVGFFKAAGGSAWEAFHELSWRANQPEGARAAGAVWRAPSLDLTFTAVAGRPDLVPESARKQPALVLYEGSSVITMTSLRNNAKRADLLSEMSEWAARQLLPSASSEEL